MSKFKQEAIQILKNIKEDSEILEMIQIWSDNIKEYDNKFFRNTNEIESLNLLIKLANEELDMRKANKKIDAK